jgi:hypothetical protein
MEETVVCHRPAPVIAKIGSFGVSVHSTTRPAVRLYQSRESLLGRNMENVSQDSAARCAGITKSGKRCRAAALKSGVMCLFHSRPGLAAELGQKGGEGNRPSKLAEATASVNFESVNDVRDLLAQATKGLIAGDISPRTATGLASLVNQLLRAIECTDLEKRIAELEKENEKQTGNSQVADKSKKSERVRYSLLDFEDLES